LSRPQSCLFVWPGLLPGRSSRAQRSDLPKRSLAPPPTISDQARDLARACANALLSAGPASALVSGHPEFDKPERVCYTGHCRDASSAPFVGRQRSPDLCFREKSVRSGLRNKHPFFPLGRACRQRPALQLLRQELAPGGWTARIPSAQAIAGREGQRRLDRHSLVCFGRFNPCGAVGPPCAPRRADPTTGSSTRAPGTRPGYRPRFPQRGAAQSPIPGVPCCCSAPATRPAS
jgi:hypothetical protein